eukprot:scaffold4073_cov401-Prasinococcus_capsulatus_cf.AAC.2
MMCVTSDTLELRFTHEGPHGTLFSYALLCYAGLGRGPCLPETVALTREPLAAPALGLGDSLQTEKPHQSQYVRT